VTPPTRLPSTILNMYWRWSTRNSGDAFGKKAGGVRPGGLLGGVSWGKKGAMQAIDAEIESQGANWKPLAAGLFAGSLERAREAIDNFKKFLPHVQMHWRM
jgi:hypothetical protein